MGRHWGDYEGDGHKVLREVYVDIEWEGLLVERAYRMDLVVDDRVVVEAKTVEKLVDAHFAQVNSQLRFSGFEVVLALLLGGVGRVELPQREALLKLDIVADHGVSHAHSIGPGKRHFSSTSLRGLKSLSPIPNPDPPIGLSLADRP